MKPSLRALLDRLEAMDPDTTAEEAFESLSAPSDTVIAEGRRLAALVRVVDEGSYGFLTKGRADLPTLDQLIKARPQDFQRVPPAGWEMTGDTREVLMRGFSDPVWRNWNTKLFHEYFEPQKTPAAEIEAVYHAAAAEPPAGGIQYFADRYSAADDRNELSHCRALLESVRAQVNARGQEFNQIYRDYTRSLEARMMFVEALQKTSFYVDRKEAQANIERMISRETQAPWIFHLHATGGLGKTTLLNRTIARDLVRRRIPCAYADFDDDEVKRVVSQPFRLLALILRQWTAQMTDEVFVSAANGLKGLDDIHLWDNGMLGGLRLQLQGAQASFPQLMNRPIVVMLDTLEELTLSRAAWLKGCIEALASLHEFLPKLTLILSGRYNMAERGQDLPPETARIYELGHFIRDEALVYLRLRKLSNRDMQEAILDRAAASTEKGVTYNPFKLALMAELVLERDDLSPDDVRKLPSADIAYLVERVILRIQSTPLRWMIRYASVARRFTQEFLKQVLLPPLKTALQGKAEDLSTTNPDERIQKYLDSKVPWEPNPALAEGLDGDALWTELKEYARARGWISLGDSNDVMRLHPEVVDPVRELLRPERVYRTLQQEARDYFLESWNKSKRAADAVEATFHARELDDGGAESLWRHMLMEAQTAGDLPGAYEIAKEATQYVISPEQREPYYPKWFAEAHVFCAKLKALEAGIDFTPQDDRWDTFVDHLAEAKRTHPKSVPSYLAVLVSAVRDNKTDLDRALALDEGLTQESLPAEQFWLHRQAATYFETSGNTAKAEEHWIAACDTASSAGVEQWSAESQLADFYVKSGRYKKAQESLKAAAAKMALEDRRNASMRGAEWALDHHDLKAAEKLISDVPREFVDSTLRLRLDAYTGTTLQDYRMPDDISLAERAPLESILGEWETYCLNFSAAREHFGNAKNAYQDLPPPTSGQKRSGWTNVDKNIEAGVREITFTAFEMGAYDEAERLIEKVFAISDPDQRAAVELARAFSVIGLGKKKLGEAAIREALALAFTPRMRLRATILALAFDLHPEPPSKRKMKAMLEALDPPNLCVEAFEFLPYCSEPSKQLAKLFRPIESWVIENFHTVGDLPGTNLKDLARVASSRSATIVGWIELLGSKLNLAVARLEDHPAPGQLVKLLLEVEASERQLKRHSSTYEQLLCLARTAGMGDGPLGALLKVKTALELMRDGKSKEARRLATEAAQVWLQQPDSRRRRHVQSSLRRLEETGWPEVSTLSMEEPERQSELEAIQPPLQLVTLRYPDPMGKEVDSGQTFELISLIFQWQEFYENLKHEVKRHPATPLLPIRAITTLEHAALPWEFVASSFTFPLFCRGVVNEAEMRTSGPLSRGVLVVKPSDEDDIGFSTNDMAHSGTAIEKVYAESASDARYVKTMHEPQPKELQEGLQSIRPGVIHLVGQMVEGTGISLDFEGAGKRLFRSASQARLESRLDPERLVRYLDGQCPFVILDITAPENITDVVRMLLQRNRFAAELLRTGQVSGILATGLWGPRQRGAKSWDLVQCVRGNGTQSSLWETLRIREEPKELSDAIRNHSTALFSLNPSRKIFGVPQ